MLYFGLVRIQLESRNPNNIKTTNTYLCYVPAPTLNIIHTTSHLILTTFAFEGNETFQSLLCGSLQEETASERLVSLLKAKHLAVLELRF